MVKQDQVVEVNQVPIAKLWEVFFLMLKQSQPMIFPICRYRP